MSEFTPAPSGGPDLFNTPLEAGLRAVVILDAFAPRAFDLKTLSLLDYYAVHARDVDVAADAPESLHPPISPRRGEYFVRRQLVEDGLALMERAFLLDRVAMDNGFAFKTRDVAAAMVDLMQSDYNAQLREAARWIAKQAEVEGHDTFFKRLNAGVDRWKHEVDGAFEDGSAS